MYPKDEKALWAWYFCRLMGLINIAVLGGMKESTFIKKMEKEAKKIENWSWGQKTISMRCLSLPRHLLPFEVSTAMVKIFSLEVWIQFCCSVLFSLLTPILLSPASAAPSPNELYPEEEGVTSLCDLAIFKHKFYLTTFANQSNFINFIKIYAIYNFLSS